MSIENFSMNKIEGQNESELNYDSDLDSLSSDLAETENRVEQLGALSPEEVQKYRRRLFALKNLVFYALFACMSFAGASELKHYSTRYNVNKIVRGVETILEHEDSETTMWINYISGRGELSQTIRFEIFRSKVKSELETGHITVPENFDTMSYGEIENYVFIDPQVNKTPLFKAWKRFNRNKQSFLDVVPKKLPKKDAIYNALWNLEAQAGNPKIRVDLNNRAHYISNTNTMYLAAFNQNDYIKQFVSETAHGVQWETSTIISDAKNLKDTIIQGGTATVQEKTMSQVRDEYAYNTPGTIEHEAHSIIEPKLKEQFDQDIKRYNLVSKQSNKNKKHGQPPRPTKPKTGRNIG